MKRVFATMIFGLLVLGVSVTARAVETKVSSESAKLIIRERAKEVIEILKNKDLKHLSRLIHPDKGLILSVGAYLSPKGNLVLNRSQIANLSMNNEKFISVPIGLSGEDKKITFDEYFKNYIYDSDYSKSTEINFNTDIERGSEGNNLFKFFPEAIIVEYHLRGVNNERDGNGDGRDWKSLYLVFEKADDFKWYLVDLAHGEKTE
jgi:hypothetical protein